MKQPFSMINSRLSPAGLYPQLVRAGVAFGLLMSLFGCKLGPDYVRPAVDIGAQFRETSGWQPVDPTMATRFKGAWWEIYKDPVLN